MESAKLGERLSIGVRAKGCGSAWPLDGARGAPFSRESPGHRKARTT